MRKRVNGGDPRPRGIPFPLPLSPSSSPLPPLPPLLLLTLCYDAVTAEAAAIPNMLPFPCCCCRQSSLPPPFIPPSPPPPSSSSSHRQRRRGEPAVCLPIYLWRLWFNAPSAAVAVRRHALLPFPAKTCPKYVHLEEVLRGPAGIGVGDPRFVVDIITYEGQNF